MNLTPLGCAAEKKHHASVSALVKKLVEEQKFTREQIGWIHNAETQMQQLNIYRNLTSIFQQKEALKYLIQYGVMNAIVRGMKRYRKASIQSSGLQLLNQCVTTPEGLEAAKKTNLKNEINEACKELKNDVVISHLMGEVINLL